jgi:hypothetical protein
MKIFLYTLLLFCLVQQFQAQDNSQHRIIRSNIGSSGSSQNVVTAKGTYNVSQSIGQASVIGTHNNNGYVLIQGYQQPLNGKNSVEEFDYNLKAEVHPNPFNQAITITFSTSTLNNISVLMYDVNAKIILAQEFLPAQEIELKLKDISKGIYFLRVVSGAKYFNTKLIKI